MTPRPGDLPAGPARFERDEPARPGQNAYSPIYSAPSPADRPTALPPSGPGASAGRVPVGDQAWSQDMSSDTGPVRAQPPNADRAWWEPRPSGAWSAPGWGASTGQPAAGPADGAHDTRAFPGQTDTRTFAGQRPGSTANAGFSPPGYPGGGYGTSAAGKSPTPTGPARTTGRRTSVIVAATAALALLAGFGGGLVGVLLGDLQHRVLHDVQRSVLVAHGEHGVLERAPLDFGEKCGNFLSGCQLMPCFARFCADYRASGAATLRPASVRAHADCSAQQMP